MGIENVNVGDRWSENSSNFCVIGKTDGKDGFWDIRITIPGGISFGNSNGTKKPIKKISLSSESVIQRVGEYNARMAAWRMSTVGPSKGSNNRRRYTRTMQVLAVPLPRINGRDLLKKLYFERHIAKPT